VTDPPSRADTSRSNLNDPSTTVVALRTDTTMARPVAGVTIVECTRGAADPESVANTICTMNNHSTTSPEVAEVAH
jgi:hypothetical protein